MNILLALVFLLVVATLVQVVRVSELLAELNKKDVNEVTDSDNNTHGILYLLIGIGFLVFVIWQMLEWNHLLLPEAASAHGAEIDMLMNVSMGLILIVFFILQIKLLTQTGMLKLYGKPKKFLNYQNL